MLSLVAANRVHMRGVAWFAMGVTSRNDAPEFRVLGPLELRLEGEPLPLGGAKQRAALALLLLQADEIVSIGRLIDEIWGDSPPPSAAHSLEAYVSRLRQLLAGNGPRLVRRGTGYTLELGDAAYDARLFAELQDAVSRAAAEDDHEQASALATQALALWRGPALADVELGASGRAEAERLEELRLRVLEQRADAELQLGRHDELVGELKALVQLNPHRERLVAQLMLSLYRSGRHADALEVYEQTRATLAGDLGLQPSAELQQLSGQIVRQEPQLRRPTPGIPALASARARRRRAGRASLLAGALAAAAMLLTASGGARQVADAAPTPKSFRIALVLPGAPTGDPHDVPTRYAERLRGIAYYGHELSTRTIVADETHPNPAAVASKLQRGRFDLVLWAGDGTVARAFARYVSKLRAMRFVFLDASLDTLGLNAVPNASAVRFADEQASELTGYMSGLVRPRGATAAKRADVVSVIAGAPTPKAKRILAGFERGLKRALPDVEVLVDYSRELVDRTRCEQLANTQIDQGSDVVFTLAGRCGAGALAVARARGVWAVDGEDSGQEGEHVLVHTYKELERAIDVAADGFIWDELPAGGDLVLGLNDDYAVGIWGTNPAVPEAVSSEVVRLCTSIRRHAQTAGS